MVVNVHICWFESGITDYAVWQKMAGDNNGFTLFPVALPILTKTESMALIKAIIYVFYRSKDYSFQGGKRR